MLGRLQDAINGAYSDVDFGDHHSLFHSDSFDSAMLLSPRSRGGTTPKDGNYPCWGTGVCAAAGEHKAAIVSTGVSNFHISRSSHFDPAFRAKDYKSNLRDD